MNPSDVVKVNSRHPRPVMNMLSFGISIFSLQVECYLKSVDV